jgi:hypothetical protein
MFLLSDNFGFIFCFYRDKVAGSIIRIEEPKEQKEIQGNMMEVETLQFEGVLKRVDTWEFFSLLPFTILAITQSSSSSLLKQTSKCFFNRFLPIHNYSHLTPTGPLRTPVRSREVFPWCAFKGTDLHSRMVSTVRDKSRGTY